MTTVSSPYNPDIRSLSDASVDTTFLSRFHHLLEFTPAPTPDKLSVELARVFANDNTFSSSFGSDDDSDASKNPSGSAVTVAKTFVNRYDSNVEFERAEVRMPVILDTVNAACFAVFIRQIAHLYGEPVYENDPNQVMDPRLRENLSNFWKEQWNVITSAVEAAMPFYGDKAKAQDPAFTNYRLEAHLAGAQDVVQRASIPSTYANVTFMNDVIKNAMFYLMQPWLVFKYVTVFIKFFGDETQDDSKGFLHNRDEAAEPPIPSFDDRRGAELAIYRMLIDAVIRTRSSLLEKTKAVHGGRMLMAAASPDANSDFPEKAVLHFFEEPGRHDLFVHAKEVEAQVLVVGGGGGGGHRDAGGGGGGGVVFRKSVRIPVGRHRVVVGAGGRGGKGASESETGSREAASDGEASMLTILTDESGDEIVALGGGRGASGAGGNDAGSGGGSGEGKGGAGGSTGSRSTGWYGGGGNGAGDVNLGQSFAQGGKGGDGVTHAIIGKNQAYGGGGSSGDTPSQGGGGQGGGGGCSRGQDGVNGIGGGGGATRSPDACARGGDGGSGVVILRLSTQTLWKDLITSIEDMGFGVTQTLNNRYIDPERKAMPDWKSSIAKLSKDTKKRSAELHQTNAELRQRINNLQVMLHNHGNVEQAARQSVIVFWVVVALYIIIASGSLTLIAMKKYNAVYLMAVLVIIAIFLWWLVTKMRGTGMSRYEADID